MSEPAPITPSRSDLGWCSFLRAHGNRGDVLERALHEIGVLQPGGWANWQPSTLTCSGAPVAAQIRRQGRGLAVVTEVDDPGRYTHERVETACAMMAKLDATPPPPALREIISIAQSTAQPRYGACLKLVTGRGRLATTLIAELPRTSGDLICLLGKGPLATALSLMGTDAAPTALSYEGRTREVTVRLATSLSPDRLVPFLAAKSDIDPDGLLRPLRQISKLAGRGPWTNIRCDISFTFGQMGGGPGLAVHLPVPPLFSTDQDAARTLGLLGFGAQKSYTALVDDMVPTNTRLMRHTEITSAISPRGRSSLAVTVAAPFDHDSGDQ